MEQKDLCTSYSKVGIFSMFTYLFYGLVLKQEKSLQKDPEYRRLIIFSPRGGLVLWCTAFSECIFFLDDVFNMFAVPVVYRFKIATSLVHQQNSSQTGMVMPRINHL